MVKYIIKCGLLSDFFSRQLLDLTLCYTENK